jgi:hypothetical protein
MHTIKFLRDDWRPAIAAPRRGRSSAGLAFARDAPGPPIHSDQRYLLSELLEHANLVAIHRESQDPLYRGEVNLLTVDKDKPYSAPI